MLFVHEEFLVLSDGWRIAILAYALAGAAGLFSGLLYRVSALIVLSFVALVAAIFLCVDQGWVLWKSALFAFGMVAVLQLGYLVGVVITVAMAKLKSKSSVRSLIAGLFKQDTVR